ncbi:MAG: hypothetical protein RR361_01005 [Anaerovorax sp.]
MWFEKMSGDEKVIARLKKSIESNRISHAYIFEGGKYTEKEKLALSFVKGILKDDVRASAKIDHGNHEDLIYVQAEGNSIKDDAIYEMQARIKKKPYVGDRNIVMIKDADTMTLRAQNRLLKTLEEPFPGTVIILLSENMEALTQTIRSRCIVYKLNSFEAEDFYRMMKEAMQIESLIFQEETFYHICEQVMHVADTRENADLLLDALEKWYRDICLFSSDDKLQLYDEEIQFKLKEKGRLYKQETIYKAIHAIEEARQDLNRNISISYTLKSMILKIGG